MSDTEARRIITVDIGRSTWQGYEGDEPVRGITVEHQVLDAETGDVITLTERTPDPRRLNIINLGEGI